MDEKLENINRLLAGLEAAAPSERKGVLKGLAERKDRLSIAGLVMALEDSEPSIREEAVNLLAETPAELATALLARFLGHENIGTRNLASEVLLKIGPPSVPALVEQLTSDDHEVRKFACDLLGLIGQPEVGSDLVVCLEDPNPNVACSAAEALGRIGFADAVGPLLDIADRRPQIRLPIAESLGRLGDAQALDFLRGELSSEEPVTVAIALEAIGKIASRQSVEVVRPFLDHQDRAIADMAVCALIRLSAAGQAGSNDALSPAQLRGCVQGGIQQHNHLLLDYVLSRPPEWFDAAMIAELLDVWPTLSSTDARRLLDLLVEIGPPVIRPLLDRVGAAALPQQLQLLDLLSQLADGSSVSELAPLVTHPEPEVRQKIAHVFGAAGSAIAIPSLKHLSIDHNAHVRAAAFAALGWLCNESEVEFLLTGLDDQFAEVREAALGALIIIGGAEVVSRLTEDLRHERAERQRLAVKALGWIGEIEVVDPLLEAVSHPAPEVRRTALDALAKIGELPNSEPLRLALSDTNASVRKAAISALLSILGEGAIEDVRVCLEDEDEWVRYHTIKALGELKSETAATAVLRRLEDESDVVRLAAAHALARMNSREAVPVLTNLTADPNPDIAGVARAALTILEGNH